MRKLWNRVLLCLLAVVLIYVGFGIADRQTLRSSLVRFHVVANSDGQADQEVKLLVRDAVIQSIQQDLSNVSDVECAKTYIQENLPKIEDIANSVLQAAGFEEKAVASFCKETFSARAYDTFTLPSGVYDALRIVIGEGNGQNWWCVTFPALCLPATSQGFIETAAQTGIPSYLAKSLSGDPEYELHFYMLDRIGKLENSLFNN